MTEADKDDAIAYELFLRNRREKMREVFSKWRDALIAKEAYTPDAATSIMLAEMDSLTDA